MRSETVALPSGEPVRSGDRPDQSTVTEFSGPLRWAWSYVLPEWRSIAVVLVLSIVAVCMGLAQPLLTKELIDNGILARNATTVTYTGLAMVVMAISAFAVGFATRRLHVQASTRILQRMREDLFGRVLAMRPDFFSRMRQGDLIARLDGDLGELQRFSVDAALSVVNALLTLLGTVILLGVLSPALSLILIVLLSADVYVTLRISPQVEERSRRSREAAVDLGSFLIERLSMVRCIQAHVAERREIGLLNHHHKAVFDRLLAFQLVGYLGATMPSLLLSLAVIAIFTVGSLSILDGSLLTLGTLIAFATYTQRATAPVHSLMSLYLQWQRVKVGAERVEELRRIPSGDESESGAPDEFRSFGQIHLENVSFRYPEAGRSVFEKLSATIPAGSCVWLRGCSGSGKSTLIDLLQRHWYPTTGSISVDDRDLQAINRKSLRCAIAVVSQEMTLMSGTLRENLCYGNAFATAESIEQVIDVTGMAEILCKLERGLDADIGVRGSLLSGGERQRIAIARALLMQPAVLVVDEGTSALEAELELRLLRTIKNSFPQLTLIIVSHREHCKSEFDLVIEMPKDRG